MNRAAPICRVPLSCLCLLFVLSEGSPRAVSSAADLAPLTFVSPQSNPHLREIMLGDSSTRYRDPEFWVDPLLVVWQDGLTQEVWIAGVDPETGQMVPPDGRDLLVDEAVPLSPGPGGLIATYNGPEFGVNSGDDLSVYYTKKDDRGIAQIAQFKLSDHSRFFLTTGGNVHRTGVLPSTNTLGPRSGLATLQQTSAFSLVFGAKVGWRFDDEPTVDRPLPLAIAGTNVARWIPNTLDIVTNMKDARGHVQLICYHTETQTFDWLTDEPIDHFDAFVFFPPEYPGRRGISCLVGKDQLAFFIENDSGTYERIQTTDPPLYSSFRRGQPYSSEPFVYRGRSYVSFSNASGQPNFSPADVYILGLGWTEPLLVSESGDSVTRTDPEVLVVDDKAFLYYSRQPSLGRIEMRLLTDFVPETP